MREVLGVETNQGPEIWMNEIIMTRVLDGKMNIRVAMVIMVVGGSLGIPVIVLREIFEEISEVEEEHSEGAEEVRLRTDLDQPLTVVSEIEVVIMG